MQKKIYITTAIDYVNSLPHLGTAYEKIAADALVRFLRMDGYEVRFQMGNDEHSTNVKKEADRLGLDPKTYCDGMRTKFVEIWKSLNISPGVSYDDFIQTSEPRHHVAVNAFIQKIYERNPDDIYLRSYEGWYCESCEAFLTEKDLVDGKCQTHKTPPKKLKERNYFFRLSKYQDRLLDFYKTHPDFILPESRRNEVLRFVESGLEDVSVSRTGFSWGIPFPEHPHCPPSEGEKHVVYVWFDALVNYLTGLEFGSSRSGGSGGSGKSEKLEVFWPPIAETEAMANEQKTESFEPSPALHIVGKDITRFHCVIWPAMLMSAGLRLPKTVFGHGFIYLKGEKMSKTLGNVVTPLDIVPKYGADALRYYLLRESSFGSDGDFTWDNFIKRYNSDLANDLGNVLNRTLGMAVKYLGGKISVPKEFLENLPKENTTEPAQAGDIEEKILEQHVKGALANIRSAMSHQESGDINFHKALSVIWTLINQADKYIDSSAPWKLIKENKIFRINRVLYHVMDTIRNVAILVCPFIPQASQKIWDQLGLKDFNQQTFEDVAWRKTPDLTVEEGKPIFPRIEINPAQPGDQKMETTIPPTAVAAAPSAASQDGLIDIADFAKVDLRIAEIKQAEKVEGADKLLKLQIDVGGTMRQIVSGIAQHYKPEELIGKKIVIVANLKPVKIRGVESHGMLLAASNDKGLSVVILDRPDIPTGSRVK